MRKSIILTILIALLSTSCSDFLGNKPKGIAIPRYYEDYALLLNGMDLGYYGENYMNYITDDVVMSDGDVPPGLKFTAAGEYDKNMYIFKNGDIFSDGMNDGFWSSSYSQIYVYNVVANNILDVPDGVESKKQAAWAEAVTCRALCYFHLVNTYAKHYDKNTAATDYGVPIIVSEDVSKSYVMNTVAEVYKLILDDLEKAAPMLPDVANNLYHPTKAAAYTLLARVHMFMGNYGDALKAAENARSLNRTGKLIDLKLYTAEEGMSSGRLVDADGNMYPFRGENPEDLMVRLGPNDFGSSIFVSDDLMAVYDTDLPAGAIDKRKELFYAKDRANTYQEMSFPGKTMYVAHINPNYGISYQELLLILAECEARSSESGSAERAMAYLDELRDMRIVGNTPLTASDNKDALKKVLDERRRETAMWGQTRYFDLRRLNTEPEFAKTVEHDLDGTKYSLPANDSRYIMPLPHNVREFNPDIPQYER